MYFVFTRMPGESYLYLWRSLCTLYQFTHMLGESYRSRLRSLLLCSCDVYRALINSLVCGYKVTDLAANAKKITDALSPANLHPPPLRTPPPPALALSSLNLRTLAAAAVSYNEPPGLYISGTFLLLFFTQAQLHAILFSISPSFDEI